MTLGQKLRQARQARGLTQAQVVGERITRNMLSQIENDLASPSVGTLEYLASVLGVKLAWLLADEQEQAALARTEQLRERYRAGDYAGGLALAPDGAPDDEQALLLALCAAKAAHHALLCEHFDAARRLAEQALRWNGQSFYENSAVSLQMRAVLARCELAENARESDGRESDKNAAAQLQSAVSQYRALYCEQGLGAQYRLTMARYYLAQRQPEQAERALGAVTDISETDRAEFLILQARVELLRGQYLRAAALLRQTDARGALPKLLERELCQSMELASREMQDYKTAYEYAARQLQL